MEEKAKAESKDAGSPIGVGNGSLKEEESRYRCEKAQVSVS
jgi:hypothetical protein